MYARTMLVEAAWQGVRGPGPLRGFYQRVSARRGNHIAAVAVACKLAVIVWHMLQKGEDYAGDRRSTAWLRSMATKPAYRPSALSGLREFQHESVSMVSSAVVENTIHPWIGWLCEQVASHPENKPDALDLSLDG
jgi:hypothetical protein